MVLRRIVVTSKQAEVQQLARRIGQQVLVADDAVEAVDIAATVVPDLILLDDLLNPGDIRTILDASHNNFRTAVVVVGNNGPPPAWFAQFSQSCNIEYLSGPNNYEQFQHILSKIQPQSKSRQDKMTLLCRRPCRFCFNGGQKQGNPSYAENDKISGRQQLQSGADNRGNRDRQRACCQSSAYKPASE